ncbi:pyridoxal-phosphate dependent enzyme [Patescibacteria group bacterium]|nr:pyridoxal-phosphate dependent enzyme [Patescibacteria group bacterium]MBU1868582.1 pyridoxal-phosphate dependent enzyme [Patescibacteria group bacterium]
MTKVPIIYYCMDCSFSAENKHFKRCPRCGGVISYERADNQYRIRQGKYDVERYWDFLPLQDPRKLIGHGNERTPLIDSQELKSKCSANKIMLKDETKNYTGTSKDRMAVVALSQMNEFGINSFVVSSTGNVASSLAFLLKKHRNIEMHCFAAEEFISRHRFMDSPNIIIHRVSSKYDSALKKAFKFANENNIYHDGGYFSVAKRAGLGMAFLEAWEESKTTFDFYFQAVSSGMGVLGVYEIATKMKKCSMIDSIPSLMCVQQSTCDPMVRAFSTGEKRILPEHIIKNPVGIAKAILTGDPTVCYPSLYKVVSDTHGSFISVSENEIKSAQKHLNNSENIMATPDGATALAGFLKYAETHPDQLKNKSVLINITG